MPPDEAQPSRFETWIVDHAMAILAVISVLVIGGGAAAFAIRSSDLRRVERLERTVRCQNSPECRQFIYQAIRELLRQREREGKEVSRGAFNGNTAVSPRPGIDRLLPQLLPPAEKPSKQDSPEAGSSPENPGKAPSRRPEKPLEPESADDMAQPAQTPEPPPRQPRRRGEPRQEPPVQLLPEVPRVVPDLPKLSPTAEEATEEVRELPCTALREIHGLC